MATAERSIGTIFGIFPREDTSRSLSSKGWLRPGHELVENAPYQKLELGGPTGLQTEWGPFDRDFVGGRWWMDANNNGYMDEGDSCFICPLLGPGHVPS